MTARAEIAVAAFCLAIGLAGMPLEPLRILGAIVICAGILASGRYVAAVSLVAVVLAGWLQHDQLRLTLLAAAALLGLAVRFFGDAPRAGWIIAALAAATATAALTLG